MQFLQLVEAMVFMVSLVLVLVLVLVLMLMIRDDREPMRLLMARLMTYLSCFMVAM